MEETTPADIAARPGAPDETARHPDRPAIVEPGATIAILGGGQLGRMLGLAAREMGYRVAILDPEPTCPARAVADRHVVAQYDDVEAALELVQGAAVATYELEHVSAAAVERIAAQLPVRPGLRALRATQDRLAERALLGSLGIPTAPWHAARCADDISAAGAEFGYPLRVKAAIGGYDGRSQVRVSTAAEVPTAFAGRVAERELNFAAEISVVCARDLEGRVVPFPVAWNVHDAGILIQTVAPAPIPPEVAAEAQSIAAKIVTALDVVGVLTVEMFLLRDGTLAVNELAPRVHNSGHYTLEACRTSQFEQQIRAICGLPLGSPEQHQPAAMVNLLGEGTLRPARLRGLDRALEDPNVHVHVYDKLRVFERRKMGHVTAFGATTDEALERARAAHARLRWAGENEP